MIYIITGEIDHGKTERILSIYKEKKGDGVISRKIFKDNIFSGYEILRLSTQKWMTLALKKSETPHGWDEIYTMGSFSFSGKAFDFAGSIIDEIIKSDINPVYIDEIGPLELEGKGFCNILNRLLTTDRDIYITVRTGCCKDIIKKFVLNDYKIIPLTTRSPDTYNP